MIDGTWFVTWLDRQQWWNGGSTWIQWLTGAVTFAGWALYTHTRFGEDRCEHCWRKGVIPVPGAVHRHCRRHAREHGITH